ncbi:glutathione S-transferase family protein [Parasphingopyxis marina]|uniref:Glutathione S-transferase family protein n=1 Tax=Parasphingopyxis marina TaxID=2761622 RepID=A0A842I310_9SPHN|nr:glutathione S-transferase family protein [Parasphingopyxis marina]MBC2778284.1 glutathione S-transferase family protein [Parasphingopyxis marina]
MAELTFYTNPMSRGQIARWMLEEIGEPYDQVILDYGTTMKGEEYLAINPMGKVPAIKDGNHVVTEAAAICAYLAEAYPDAGLAPTAEERADYYRWLFFAAGPVEAAVTSRHMQWEPTDEQKATLGFGSFDDAIGALEQWFTTHDYVCGDRFTAADVYVGAQVDWGLTFGTIPECEAFTAYAERLRGRAAYKKAKEIDQALMPQEQPATS